ncbi:ShlB/FhaC/HecB family hemolysin secretion/activation protein [Massilia sp. TW-1]|uniref:ShlB/FhaC/HecB family hemolysin secretion/activation protein n=2 Tax=Telluria antibiotica TaxID=2717319 RepID=A0ABX0P899_9BURK|nr:ShlB/FhaC/HecB family hemolysin secretion/activation protein [Telluria antibiotica]
MKPMTFANQPRLLSTPLAAALLLAALDAHADQAGVPNAGELLRQVQPAAPAAPPSNQPALQVRQADSGATPASVPFEVRTVRIVGNAGFSTDTLHALVADAEGRTLTLAALQALAGRITDYYQRHGFPLSRAIIPAQKIADGTVTIQVLEARYGKVAVDNGSRVNDTLLAATAAPLQSGQPIANRELDRVLLLLSDIPGVTVNAVLKPGAEVGTSDIDVVMGQSASSAATLAADNYGNRYIGRARVGASIDVFSPLHHGDVLGISAISTGTDMNYGRLAYDTLLDGGGDRIGVSYSFVHYKLGGEVRALDAHGTAGVASAWFRHPLLRSKTANAYVQAQYDDKRLRDRVGVTDTRTDRTLGNWVLTLNGDVRDDVLAGGVTVWNMAWTAGRTGFDAAAAGTADAASARTRGGFSKWNANVSRIQGVGGHDTLYLNAAAQWADANLDSAEKMTVGGPYTVRAYDVGAVSSDTGWFGSAELRHDFGTSAAGRWQAATFVEGAHVKINRHPWTAADNTASLSGAGLALIWDGPDGWRASLSVATPIGAKPALLASTSSVRAWAIVNKAF